MRFLRSLPLMILLSCARTEFRDGAEPIRFSWPCSGLIFQGFYGDKISGEAPGSYYDEKNRGQFFSGLGRMHRGVDIDNAAGVSVFAAADGIAHVHPWDHKNDYGNCVVVDHENGYWTLYAHLSAIRAKNGDAVSVNSVLGDIGSTGNSTGPHLHFEIRHSGDGDTLKSPHYVPGKPGETVHAHAPIEFDYPPVK